MLISFKYGSYFTQASGILMGVFSTAHRFIYATADVQASSAVALLRHIWRNGPAGTLGKHVENGDTFPEKKTSQSVCTSSEIARVDKVEPTVVLGQFGFKAHDLANS